MHFTPWLTLAVVSMLACAKPKTEASPLPTQAKAETHTHVDASLIASGRVKIGAVEWRAPRVERRFPGEVRAGDGGRAEVGAIVVGRVAQLPVVLGQKVDKGTVLARIDAPEVAHAAADVVRARARAEVAQRKLQRQLDLDAQGATSKNALDDAKAEATVTAADLSAARILLRQLGGEEGGAQAVLRSPIAGIVVERNATLGSAASPDKTLFVVVGGKALVVFAKIPETAALVTTIGEAAHIIGRTTDATEAKCEAKVDGDLGVIDETRTKPLRLLPAVDCTWATPGRFVEVVFVRSGSEGPGLVLPREAIVLIHGVPNVFVEVSEGTFERRAVRVRKSEGPDAVLEDGVATGERVVVVGAVLLQGEMLRQELGGQ